MPLGTCRVYVSGLGEDIQAKLKKSDKPRESTETCFNREVNSLNFDLHFPEI